MMKATVLPSTKADSRAVQGNRSGLGGQLVTWAGSLLTSPMNAGIKFRLVAFVLAIALVFAAIVFIAHTSWQRIDELRKRLTSVQLESFLIAEHFQKSILDLNNSLLRYEIQPDPAEWNYFHSQSVELNSWIDEQFKQFGPRISPTETNLLRKLDVAYDEYLRAATNLQVTESRPRSSTDKLREFSSVKH